MYKKIIACAALAVCFAVPANAAENLRFVNDGAVVLDGTVDGIRKGQTVTLTVSDSELEWENKNVWLNGNSDGIVFYGDCIAEEEGKYCFKFGLESSGLYTAYIGTNILEKPQKRVFEFIDADKNAAAISAITATGADIAEILRDERNNLGLFTKAYEKADIDAASEILGASLSGMTAPDTGGMIEVAEKALLASALNKKNISDVDSYTDVFENDGIFKYYSSDFSKTLTDMMSGAGIADKRDFDKKLTDSIILCTVNRSGSGKISDILTEYAGYINIDKSKITVPLCSAMAAKGNFANIAEISDYVKNYTEPNNPQGSGNGGGGGGSSSSGKNNYSGTTVDIPKNAETNPDNYSVFLDISDVAWAKDAITKLYYKGIISGRTETEFCPNEPVKREEFVKMLTGALNTELVGDEFPFADVTPDDWCYSYVKTAYLAGIASGISDTLFGRGTNITRQDLCVMVYRGMNACDIEIPEKDKVYDFADSEIISEYAKEAASALQRAGIVSGDESGRFNPRNCATRAEAARIIYSLMVCAKRI